MDRYPPQVGASDGVSWRGSNCSDYPINNVVAKVYDNHEPILPIQSIKTLWHLCVPPRARLTLWFAMLGKLKTGDLLVEKGIIDSQQAICPFCRIEVESNSYIFFTCHFSWGIWMRLLSWWGLQGVLHYEGVSFVLQ